MGPTPSEFLCARCGVEVTANRERFEVFERMHYVCFHYEFEHDTDPDEGCLAMGCPSSSFGGPYTYHVFPLTVEGRVQYRKQYKKEPPGPDSVG